MGDRKYVSRRWLFRLRALVALCALVALVALVALGCTKHESGTGQTEDPGKGASMRIESSAFQHQGEIPAKYTCEGNDISPPLSWSGAPDNTKSYALIIDDPDAPDPAAPKRVWVHWVLYDIPPSVTSLPEATKAAPAGAHDGKNDWGKTGYGGPCPPIGRHRYFHKIYALDTTLGDKGQLDKAALVTAMKGHVLASGELVGTYQKKGK